MAFDKRTLVLPEGTSVEEHTIITHGDVILGNHVELGFGLKTSGRIFIGQGVKVDGDVRTESDLRMDQSAHILGDVESGANAYIGERCFIQGDLALEGDLDVGDDVRITGQLKAKGWVQKRNPVPLIIYIFIYLLELLRMGQSEEVERILKELEEADETEIAVDEVFLFVPDNSGIDLQKWTIKGGLDAGADCRILGNLQVKGDTTIGDGTTIHGALRAEGDVTLYPGTEIEGDLVASGHVVVGEDCSVLGDLHAKSVEMYTSATVDGKIIAEDGVKFRTEAQERKRKTGEEKTEEFDGKAADLVDLLG